MLQPPLDKMENEMRSLNLGEAALQSKCWSKIISANIQEKPWKLIRNPGKGIEKVAKKLYHKKGR